MNGRIARWSALKGGLRVGAAASTSSSVPTKAMNDWLALEKPTCRCWNFFFDEMGLAAQG
jgi:hypothetical protein